MASVQITVMMSNDPPNTLLSVREGVVFPDGSGCFHSGDISDVTHHNNIHKVDNMGQTSVKEKVSQQDW